MQNNSLQHGRRMQRLNKFYTYMQITNAILTKTKY